ncbi:MAG: hypothetical protein AAF869_12100, partial [Pseudomonadota bacterium]
PELGVLGERPLGQGPGERERNECRDVTELLMMAKADRCYALLRESVAKLEHVKAAKAPKKQGELDALFIWTAIHGLASALQSDTIDVIGLSPTTLRAAAPHLLNRIGDAMAVAGIGGGDGDDEADDAGP